MQGHTSDREREKREERKINVEDHLLQDAPTYINVYCCRGERGIPHTILTLENRDEHISYLHSISFQDSNLEVELNLHLFWRTKILFRNAVKMTIKEHFTFILFIGNHSCRYSCHSSLVAHILKTLTH